MRNQRHLLWQVAFSHFGDMLVSSGGDFQVVLWNMKDFTIFAIYDEAMAPVLISHPNARMYLEVFRGILTHSVCLWAWAGDSLCVVA